MQDQSIVKRKSIFGATMLVTGCCIGAGMIGLPVMSAFTGFMPSIAAMLLCYLFTTLTGLLLVEATLWFDGKVNLPSIVEFALRENWQNYYSHTLFVSILLFICRISRCWRQLICRNANEHTHIQVPHEIGVLTCMLGIVAIAYMGATSLMDLIVPC